MREPRSKLDQAFESAALVIVGGLLASIIGMYLYVLFVVVASSSFRRRNNRPCPRIWLMPAALHETLIEADGRAPAPPHWNGARLSRRP